MFPFFFGPGCLWFLPIIGIVVFMMLAWFLFRRVIRGGAFCCAGAAGGKDAGSGDPLRILTSRYAKGEISREEYERMRKEIRE
jgi:uncharacterized membrane protein